MVENIKCPVGKENIGLSSYGKAPCELCALIESMREKVNEMAKQVKQLEPVKAYERMKKEFLKLDKMHLKCAGCGLCFGEGHIAMPKGQVKGLGTVCQWCVKEIDNIGLSKFMDRLKHQTAEEVETGGIT